MYSHAWKGDYQTDEVCIVKKIVMLLMALSLLLAACKGGGEGGTIRENEQYKAEANANVMLTSGMTVMDLKKKYGAEQQKAIMPMYNVEQNKEFIFEFNANISDYDISEGIVSVHTDRKALPESEILAWDWVDYKDGKTNVSVT